MLPARRPPVGRNISRVGLALILAFRRPRRRRRLLAGHQGLAVFVGVGQSRPSSPPLATSSAASSGIATARSWRRRRKDRHGEPYRVYVDDTVSPVIGYASRQFGTAGLERAYDGQLTGITRSDPLRDLLKKFDPNPYDPQDLTLSLSLALQRAAVAGLGKDVGAVVMLDPRTGEVLAMASTPTFNANGVANPTTAARTFAAIRARCAQPAACPAPRRACTSPGRCSRS